MLDSLCDVALALPGPSARRHRPTSNATARSCAPAKKAVQAAGVRAGMSINAALALVPGLHALARDARRERQLLEAVAQCGVRFTPG